MVPPVLIPLVLLLASAPSNPPGAIEIRPGLFVVLGTPGPATFAGLKAAGVTHVLNLRREGEADPSGDRAAAEAAGADYGRCPMDREPGDAALDAFRRRMKALPKEARVLVHCASGNRVAGALFAFWVLDQGLEEARALELARRAGLSNPATERAVKAYVARLKGR
ncbi:MAG: hypothetical protein HY823_06185 [Acidobacteria bacterium]|nr:hypothetical protein [Acidobacteriota bacterium]